ncbi:MAG: hypothetical protein ATN36_02585 [Epulopiscium sp. Nele67-Bin005]|nr:MAG: hypothetical protein ATN36_02585 [Epulopiscium sp. Nele67-Bin005]
MIKNFKKKLTFSNLQWKLPKFKKISFPKLQCKLPKLKDKFTFKFKNPVKKEKSIRFKAKKKMDKEAKLETALDAGELLFSINDFIDMFKMIFGFFGGCINFILGLFI